MMEFQRIDPIWIIKRDGSSSNPYIPYEETWQVAQSKIILNEVPDELTRVRVKDKSGNNLYETKSQLPKENEFYVDYQYGHVFFNSVNEGKEFTFIYKGRGVIKIPYSRIYFKNNSEQETIQTLGEISQESYQNGQYALEQGNYALEQGNYAKATNKSVQAAELIRKSAEDSRVQAENERITNENNRKDAETTRQQQEQTRQDNEELRKTAEDIREQNEDERITTEATRIRSENERITNENNRKSAETIRVNNENTRKSEHASRIQSIDTIITNTKYIEPYNSTTQYYKNNIVSYNGSSFIAKQDTKGNKPTGYIDDAYWGLIGYKGEDGVGSVSIHQARFVATANQTIFTLPFTYEPLKNKTRVYVGGVPQNTPENYRETNEKTITLLEGVPAGVEVYIEVFSTEFDDRITEFDAKMVEMDTAIDGSIVATTKASNAATNANNAATNATNQANNAKTINESIQAAEQVRVQNENTRKSAEDSRVQAESERVTNEDNRKSAETIRQQQEQTRQDNEASRGTAEQVRVQNENTRKSAEDSRVQAESERVTNENNRKSAETIRVNNENTRKSEHASRIQSIDTIITNTKYIEPYNSTTQYYKNNIVSYNGSSFIAKQDTKGNPPPDISTSIENTYWALLAKKGESSSDLLNIKEERFVATEGQTVFTINGTYAMNQNRIDVIVGGVPQYVGENYIETSTNKFTLTEGVPAGTVVRAKYINN